MMIRRQILSLLCGTILVLCTAAPLWAGGWVVVTLDTLPRDVQAGEPVMIGFTVRQHGVTLINVNGPLLSARHVESGETIELTATQDKPLGHYRAQVTFPTAGLWTWQIEPRPFTTVATMPPLTVQHSALTDEPGAEIVATQDEHPLLQWLASIQQWFAEVALAQGASVEATTAVQTADEALVTYGHDLFLAKGCAACHLHEAVTVEWRTESGPNLTSYDKTVTFLALWLADPAQVKPTTDMPNLGLASEEIDALAAFLTGTE